MIGWERDTEWLLEELPRFEPLLINRKGEDAEIDRASVQPLQQHRGTVLIEQQLQAGQNASNSRSDARQEVGADGRNECHLQSARQGDFVLACDTDDSIAFLQHPACSRHDLLAHFRERDSLRLALDQGDAQVVLELTQLRAERRLTDETAFRGATEMPFIRERHQIAQVLEFQIAHDANICHLWNSSKQLISPRGCSLRSCAPFAAPAAFPHQQETDLMLGIGQKFPEFALTGVIANDMQSAFRPFGHDSFQGKWKVIFFWPKDFTFVCPTEIAAFGKLNKEFMARDAQVLGVSVDSEFVHLAWRKDKEELRALPFPMLSDVKRELAGALGILDPEAGVSQRATYIVDPQGVIRFVYVTDRNVGRSPEEVLRVLDGLQTDELCPCNWKKGEETLKAA